MHTRVIMPGWQGYIKKLHKRMGASGSRLRMQLVAALCLRNRHKPPDLTCKLGNRCACSQLRPPTQSLLQ